MLKQKMIKKFVERTKSEILTLFHQSSPQSLEEYFCLAAIEGLKALREGNYGIGAIYIYRTKEKEYIIGGHNRMISKNNTGLHAEEDVINAVEGLSRGEKRYKKRIIFIRKNTIKGAKKILVSTLEPCIGCVQRILTHKVDEVWIGAEDEPSGAMLSGRDKGLPVLWQNMRKKQKLKVVLFDNLQPKFKRMLWDIFNFNRQDIDKIMEERGLSGMVGLEKRLEEMNKIGKGEVVIRPIIW